MNVLLRNLSLRNLTRWPVCGALGLLLLACSESSSLHESELAAELRALQTRLHEGSAAARAEADRTALVEALAPLRGVLESLAGEQRALAQRQVSLTQELQRWTALVAQGVAAGPQQELLALRQRLATFEEALTAQEVRHVEVEQMLRSALERTADQLEAFLLRVQPKAPVAPPTAPAGNGAATGGETAAPGTVPGRGQVAPLSLAPHPSELTPWLVLLVAAGMAFTWLCWRRTRTVAHQAAAEEGPGMDRGVEEIWAAAQLLGRAVGRLRDTAAPGEGDDSYAVAAELSFDADAAPAELLPQELLPDAAAEQPAPEPAPACVIPSVAVAALPPNSPPARPRPIASELTIAPSAVPPTALFVVPLPVGDQTRALQALQQVVGADPRILRRPAPEVLAGTGRAAVRCHLLPALPPGERAHLEQRLRDAIA